MHWYSCKSPDIVGPKNLKLHNPTDKNTGKETDFMFGKMPNLFFCLHFCTKYCKVEKILKGSLDSIPSPSPLVKIQIIGRKIWLMCKGKTLLGVVNILLETKRLLTTPGNVLLLHLKQTFLPIIWIFTEIEGDEMESRLYSSIFFILMKCF